jgi:hypothetical protein
VRVHILCVLALLLLGSARAVKSADEPQRLQAVKRLYEQQKWEEALREAQGAANQAAEFDYYAGMALSRLQRWREAREVFSLGATKQPGDPRFLVERAGAEYKLNDFPSAKRDLLRSLRLDKRDPYVPEFLATIYLLEGNVEAALKYWNQSEKPRLAALQATPTPKTKRELLDRAVVFSPPGTLELQQYFKTNALLENLEVFPQWRTELSPAQPSSPSQADSDDYNATIHLNERDRWGSSAMDSAISLLRGLAYDTVYPSYYNLLGDAVNFDALARWDSQKRRVSAELNMPLFQQPAKRLRIYFDARNENWNLSRTFLGSPVPITDLNLKRFAGGAEIHLVQNGNWSLTTGVEGISRDFQNVLAGVTTNAGAFFTSGKTVDAWLGAHRALLRAPERRFTLDGEAELRAGRNYASGLGAFAATKGELQGRWLPKARGDDYESLFTFRGGNISGDVPLDQLYQLGVERDNDLWLRGHAGTLDGRKGRAPLGRRYLLLNSGLYKTVYDGAFFRVQLGPFFDTGAIADPSGGFGSQKWLFDTGIQARIRVLGSVSVLLSYGRDLRNGPGVFYGTSLR